MNNTIVNQFFQKMTEKNRNGLSIAANTNLDYDTMLNKLKKKYNIKEFNSLHDMIDVDSEKLCVYKVNGKFYGVNSKANEYWNLDARTVEKEVPVYENEYDDEGNWRGSHKVPGETEFENVIEFQINSTVTDKNILEFLKAYNYLNNEGAKLRKNRKETKSAAANAERKMAESFIKVNILDSKFRTPEDFCEDVMEEDGDWEGLDEEADFTIEVSAGQKKLFTARAEVILYFGGYNETTYHSSATYWSPEEWGGTATVSYNGIDDYLGLYVNKDQEISIESFAEQIPEGKFRDLYIKYAKQIIDNEKKE